MGTLPCKFSDEDTAQIESWRAQFEKGESLTPNATVVARFSFKRPSLFTGKDILRILELLKKGPPKVLAAQTTEVMLDENGNGKMVMKFEHDIPCMVPVSDESGWLVCYAFCMVDQVLPENTAWIYFQNLEAGQYFIGTFGFVLHRKGFLMHTSELVNMFLKTPPSHSGQRQPYTVVGTHPVKLLNHIITP